VCETIIEVCNAAAAAIAR